MDGLNLPSLSNDWFATTVISVVSAIIAGLILQLAENKIPGNKTLNFLSSTILLACVAILVWYNILGIAIFGLGDIVESLQGCVSAFPFYKNAVMQNPRFVPARDKFAECAIAIKRPREALLVLEPLQDSLVYSWSYWRELSVIYYADGNYPKMLSAIERAADLKPQDSAWITNLGEQLHRQLRYADAEAVLRVVRVHNGNDGNAVFWLAWALYEQAKYQDAIAHFDICIQLNPSGYNLARCMAGKGFALRSVGRYAEARSLFETSLTLFPDQPDVSAALSQMP
jgi:tetratricopeptide (TPR) repeat protein